MITPVSKISSITVPRHIERVPDDSKTFKKRAAGMDTQNESIMTAAKSREAILEIEQYEVFANLGYKCTRDLLRDSVENTYRHTIEYIGKTAEDGDRLAAIELGGTPIADMAERDAFPEKIFGLEIAPYTGPKIDVKYITRTYGEYGKIVGTKVDRFI